MIGELRKSVLVAEERGVARDRIRHTGSVKFDNATANTDSPRTYFHALVKPLGFSLDDRQLKRAGLDYWDDVDLRTWDSFLELQNAQPAEARYFFLTTKTKRAYHAVKFQRGMKPNYIAGNTIGEKETA